MKSITLKQLVLGFVTGFIILFQNNGSAQMSKKEMISYYKYEFLSLCTEPFAIDTGWRDEICPLHFDGIDKRSYFEIDSMSALVGNIIWAEINSIAAVPNAGIIPGNDCVLWHCLDQYESKDLD